jgi:hypothetical protein
MSFRCHDLQYFIINNKYTLGEAATEMGDIIITNAFEQPTTAHRAQHRPRS